jgi:hypothetical protein
VSSRDEMLAIPKALREAVRERDQGFCRVCGRCDPERIALHHIVYGGDAVGMGGRRFHALENLVSVAWVPGHDCHRVVHSRKALWVPLLQEVVRRPGVTALQLRRWTQTREARAARGVHA